MELFGTLPILNIQSIKKCLWVLPIVLLLSFAVNGQDVMHSDSIGYDMSLEQLMNIPIKVGSIKGTKSRDAASIISLITREEISKSGAQDLQQLLWLVPGFDFSADVSNVVSTGLRGNGAQDGKVLLLLDGQEMNELYFASIQLGGHFSLDQIERIEIIRGPGSSMYGGFAEYGVINIVTLGGSEHSGISAAATMSSIGKDINRKNLTLNYGRSKEAFAYNISLFRSAAMRSNRDYTDFKGNVFDMTNNSDLEATNVNLGLRLGKLSFRGIADHYRTDSRDQFYLISSKTYPKEFISYLGELKYEWKINEKIIITPKIKYKRQLPWLTKGTPEPEDEGVALFTNAAVERTTANVNAQYNLNDKISILSGIEYYYDNADLREPGNIFYNNSTHVSFSNVAVFGQALVETSLVNVTLGARYDNHSLYSSVFVPRLGLTKTIDKFHAKVLYSNSFRAPVIQNINFAIDQRIEPEKTAIAELEVGYRLTTGLQLNLNAYDITTRQPIIYFYEEGIEGYTNFNRMGTRGAEVELKNKAAYGFTNISYSFYTTAGKDVPAIYSAGHNASLAYAPHKFTANSSIILFKGIHLNPSLIWLGKRYGYATEDIEGNPQLTAFDPSLIANAFVSFSNVGFSGLDVQLGVSNLLDSKYNFIQYYNSGHAPLPGASREFVVKAIYRHK